MIHDVIMFILLCVFIGWAGEHIYKLIGIHFIKCKKCGTKIKVRNRHTSESELASIFNYTTIGNKYYCPRCTGIKEKELCQEICQEN
jgi:hypothetical protein